MHEGLSAIFQCSARPFKIWNILNIYKGMNDDQLTVCTTARSNQNGQSLWELQWLGHASRVPAFPSKVWGNMSFLNLSAIFQWSVRPFETFWIFTRNEWGPADHMSSCQKQSEWPKSLRVAVAWPCAPSASVKSLGQHVIFECTILIQCTPLWNILNIYKEWAGTSCPCAELRMQEAIRTAKAFEGCSGLAMCP